ncbi:hypothetical protein LLG96_09200, partial [bacterium]|nr:hypothetical protein [bacterium]
MKSLLPRSRPVFRECVNSRAFGSLGQHPFFFRKTLVTAGLFNGVEKTETPKRCYAVCYNKKSWILRDQVKMFRTAPIKKKY